MNRDRILKEIMEWAKSFAIALIVTLLLNVFVFELYTVEGASMEPTLHSREHLFAWKATHFFKVVPDYEEIVIVDGNVKRLRTIKDEFIDNAIVSRLLNRENRYIWVKRVIGKPGDVIEVRKGELYRNGEVVKEDYIKEGMIRPFGPFKVPEGHIFVMGDNRNYSKDSRIVGAIPLENVRGRVLLRFYPINKMKTF